MPQEPFGGHGRINAFGHAPGPRDWSPPSDPLAPGPGPRPPRRVRRRGGWTSFVGLLVLLVGVPLGIAAVHGDGRPPAVATVLVPGVAPGDGVATTMIIGPSDDVANATAPVLSESTPVGTCLTAAAPRTVDEVPCTSAHRFELVAHERASGGGYPGDDYWDGPVSSRCYADVLAYVAEPRDAWPTGLGSSSFIPSEQGWAGGDRSVYCVAAWSADAATSARGLPPATPSAVRPAAGSSAAVVAAAPVVLSGDLVVVADPAGSAGCLGLATTTGTFVVTPSGAAYSWAVVRRGDGSPDDSRSGIVRGARPFDGDVVAHTGTSVRLTGQWQPNPGPAGCAATTVFRFSGVG